MSLFQLYAAAGLVLLGCHRHQKLIHHQWIPKNNQEGEQFSYNQLLSCHERE